MEDLDLSGCRRLWTAVLLQVFDDVEKADIDSVISQQAEGFFVGGGQWLKNRTEIADLLEMDPEVLAEAGRKWVDARRRTAGLPPLNHSPPVRARTDLPTPRSQVQLVFRNQPAERPASPRNARAWKRGDANPFNPHRKMVH